MDEQVREYQSLSEILLRCNSCKAVISRFRDILYNSKTKWEILETDFHSDFKHKEKYIGYADYRATEYYMYCACSNYIGEIKNIEDSIIYLDKKRVEIHY